MLEKRSHGVSRHQEQWSTTELLISAFPPKEEEPDSSVPGSQSPEAVGPAGGIGISPRRGATDEGLRPNMEA